MTMIAYLLTFGLTLALGLLGLGAWQRWRAWDTQGDPSPYGKLTERELDRLLRESRRVRG